MWVWAKEKFGNSKVDGLGETLNSVASLRWVWKFKLLLNWRTEFMSDMVDNIWMIYKHDWVVLVINGGNKNTYEIGN